MLCTCDVEGSLALDPPQNKSESGRLFRAYGKLANNVGVNLGLDWSPMLARGFSIHLYIRHQVLRFLTPSDNGKHGLQGLKILTVLKFPKFPCNVLRQKRHLARINDSDIKLKRIWATEDELIEETTQPKDFNTRVHLKYNKVLIGDDKTNNDKI